MDKSRGPPHVMMRRQSLGNISRNITRNITRNISDLVETQELETVETAEGIRQNLLMVDCLFRCG